MSLASSPSVIFQVRKPIRGHLVWWLRFLGLAAFAVLLLRLTSSQPVGLLLNVDARWIAVCMGVAVVQVLVEAWVWQVLLASQHIPHPYRKTLVAYLASQYLGIVTPGHVGEFLAAGYVSMNTGITFGYALSSVVMKKLLNWLVIVGCGLWGMELLVRFPLVQGVGWVVATGTVVVLIFAAGLWIWAVSLQRLAKKWEKLSPWQIDVTELKAGIRQLFSPALVVALLLTALAFSSLFVQLYAILRSLGISLPWLLIAQVMAFSRLVARVIPVSVLGFGSKDAALIWVLSQHGISASVGLTATLLLLISSYLVTLILSALGWWIKPLIVRRAQKSSL